MPRNGKKITLTLDTETQRKQLEKLAIEFGATWGNNPNISQLIQMIADGSIQLYKPGSAIAGGDTKYYKEQIDVLQSAVNNLNSLC